MITEFSADPWLSFIQAGQAECSFPVALPVGNRLHPEAAGQPGNLPELALVPPVPYGADGAKGTCG